MIEIVAKDGTVYRIYGENSAMAKQTSQDSNSWDEGLNGAANKKRPA